MAGDHWKEAYYPLLARLAQLMIPADDFDQGVTEMDPAGTILAMSDLMFGKSEEYRRALPAFDESAEAMFGRSFLNLGEAEQLAVMQAVQNGTAPGAGWQGISGPGFMRSLRFDVTFVYLAYPEVQERLGFPGPSEGYPDMDKPQS